MLFSDLRCFSFKLILQREKKIIIKNPLIFQELCTCQVSCGRVRKWWKLPTIAYAKVDWNQVIESAWVQCSAISPKTRYLLSHHHHITEVSLIPHSILVAFFEKIWLIFVVRKRCIDKKTATVMLFSSYCSKLWTYSKHFQIINCLWGEIK